ncbi:uncharacterized protein [Aegilops tauschii subsp. strangulata]|uniref:uncharacterized protein n=1 Tax=Aegilops tauschii subsp. strangulata TaxID=200361 RepID=UPI00098B2E20|nr:uncharacterized protein LOC109753881 [Aegilops tauschii subsp. strangulata]
MELPVKGRTYTWSNMQDDPLLEQLDWFFSSTCWTTSFPNTMILPLGKPVSDHIPCVVAIESKIPKSKLFRFENFWVNHEGFSNVVVASWSKPCHAQNSAAIICKKLKTLRYDLKRWSTGISKLKNMIQNSNETLLKYQNEYWRKRCTIRFFRIIRRIEGLDQLSAPFTNEEIDAVIKEMPNDRAPGPDGFNGCFLKSCWQIIKTDFYKMCHDFQAGGLDITSISEGYITLIPKISSPETANDYKPITLLNCCLEIITKILANRLQEVILKIIHKNQYGFIKGRTIQDCLAWTFEYIHQCHASEREIILLKLDFANAFDMIEHAPMLEIMKHMGFDDKWLDLLQAAINDAFASGLIDLPLPQDSAGDFPVVQYADDTILVMQACADQAARMKSILEDYAASRASELAGVFGCSVGSLPFTYLGLLMGTTRPNVMDLMPTVHTVERKTSTALSLMSSGAKLTLAKNSDDGVKNNSLAAWELVCRPKRCGGLGVIDIKTQNVALLLKHLFKFCNHEDVPWVELIWSAYYRNKIPHATDVVGSFWWKDVMQLIGVFRGITRVIPGDGSSSLFWKDVWLEGDDDAPIMEVYPRAFSFCLNEDDSVARVLTATDPATIFSLPLSTQAREESNGRYFITIEDANEYERIGEAAHLQEAARQAVAAASQYNPDFNFGYPPGHPWA